MTRLLRRRRPLANLRYAQVSKEIYTYGKRGLLRLGMKNTLALAPQLTGRSAGYTRNPTQKRSIHMAKEAC